MHAAISFTPSSHNFGSEYIGGASDPSSFTLTNISSREITVTDISVADSNFRLTENTCGKILPKSTCTITIGFAPQTSGIFSASAIVTYLYKTETYVLSVGFTGRGVSQLNFEGITSVSNVQATTATANWIHIPDAVSYLIFYQNNNGTRTFLGSVNAPNDNFAITNLTENTTYTFEVQAVDFNSGITQSTATSQITTAKAPVLTAITDFNFPHNYLVLNAAMSTIDIDNTITGDDSNMTYTCHYDKVVDGLVDTSTALTCEDLTGIASFDSNTGVLNWTPNNNAFGAYEILITGSLYVDESSGTELFVLSVRSNYSLVNLLIDIDAQFANYSHATAMGNTLSTWSNIFTTGTSYDGDLNGPGLESNWQGDGSYTNPYSLLFSGVDNHKVDLGTAINGNTDLMFSMWIKPGNSAELGTVILSNKGIAGDGFELLQSPENANKLRLMIGTSPEEVPYENRVLNYGPVAYYRLDEAIGNLNVLDSSGSLPANNGTYAANVTREQEGAISGNDSVRFTGTAPSFISVPNSADLNLTANGFTLSAWVYLESTTGYRAILGKGTSPYDYLWSFNTGTRRQSLYMSTVNGVWTNTSNTDVPLNTWTHIATSYNKTTKRLQYYLNGIPDGHHITASDAMVNTTANLSIGNMIHHTYPFVGRLDEVAIYDHALTDAQVYNLYSATPSNCETTSSLVNDVWVNVAGTYDSGTDLAKLYINGTEECSGAYGNTFSPASTSLTMGAKSNGSHAWNGAIANLKVYSSGNADLVSSLFAETRTPFVDTDNVVQDNLVLNLDAAIANGTGFPGAGCAYTNWMDLSPNSFTGTLTNFAGCGAESGWNGDGSKSNPYTLDFNLTEPDDYVSFPDHNNLNIPNEISIMLWLKPDLFTQYHGLVGKGTSPYNYVLSIVTGTQRIALYTSVNPSWNNRNNTDLVAGSWQFVAATFNATTGVLRYYYNGSADGDFLLATGTMPSTATILEIGNMINNNYPYDGSISNVLIYNRALSPDEVYQNCLALQGNFAGVTCSQ